MDDGGNELEEVVGNRVVGGVELELPCETGGDGVAPEAPRVRVGEQDVGGPSDRDQVEADSGVCLEQKVEPEAEIVYDRFGYNDGAAGGSASE